MPRTTRTDALIEIVEEIVQGLGETGITPGDGMTVAELVLWTLMNNALQLARTPELQEQAKQIAMRCVVRISSRIEAWPAKPADRN